MVEQRGTVSQSQRDGLDFADKPGLQQTVKKERYGSADQGSARAHVIISGLVQGVGYRYFAVTAARHLGVTGWIRNLMSGEVELEAQASRPVLREFLATIRSGNKWSRVYGMDVTAVPVIAGESGFTVFR